MLAFNQICRTQLILLLKRQPLEHICNELAGDWWAERGLLVSFRVGEVGGDHLWNRKIVKQHLRLLECQWENMIKNYLEDWSWRPWLTLLRRACRHWWGEEAQLWHRSSSPRLCHILLEFKEEKMKMKMKKHLSEWWRCPGSWLAPQAELLSHCCWTYPAPPWQC